MAAKVNLEFALIMERCLTCGVPFGLADYYQTSMRETHQSFYCPNGHTQYYPGQTRADRLLVELETAARKLEFSRNENRTLQTELTKANNKAHRVRKRVASGVCPCCNRHFTDSRLAKHISTKHPDWTGKV